LLLSLFLLFSFSLFLFSLIPLMLIILIEINNYKLINSEMLFTNILMIYEQFKILSWMVVVSSWWHYWGFWLEYESFTRLWK
jgi:hypothetical protein